jgi:hypothetical protein
VDSSHLGCDAVSFGFWHFWGTAILRNVGNHSPNKTASHPRTLCLQHHRCENLKSHNTHLTENKLSFGLHVCQPAGIPSLQPHLPYLYVRTYTKQCLQCTNFSFLYRNPLRVPNTAMTATLYEQDVPSAVLVPLLTKLIISEQGWQFGLCCMATGGVTLFKFVTVCKTLLRRLYLNAWEWSTGGVILTGGTRSTGRKTLALCTPQSPNGLPCIK